MRVLCQALPPASGCWKSPFPLCLPSLKSLAFLLSTKMQTPLRGQIQIPYWLSLDSEIGKLICLWSLAETPYCEEVPLSRKVTFAELPAPVIAV